VIEDKALVRNAADKKQVKSAAEQVKIDREEEIADCLHVMDTEQGRRFIDRIVNKICHYDTTLFNPSGSGMYYEQGERNVGRIIKGDCCEASLELYQKAEKENWKKLQGKGAK